VLTPSDLIGFGCMSVVALVGWLVAEHDHRMIRRQRAEDLEAFFREIYGPAGKPKKPVTAEPESPKRSVE